MMRGAATAALALVLASCDPGPARAPELAVDARPVFDGLQVTVPGDKTFTECTWTLNDEFKLMAHHDLEPGRVTIPFFAFADTAGQRFRWPGMKLEKLVVDCDGTGARQYVYLTWGS